MLEVLARSNNTAKSRVICAAIKRALEADTSATEIFGSTWDVSQVERLKKLAQYDRTLLNYDEERMLNEI